MIAVAALWLGLLGAGYAGARLYGWYTLRRRPDGRRSLGMYRLLAVVGFGTGIVLALSGLLEATENTLSSVHPALGDGTGATLAWLPVLGGAIVATLVAYLGVFPYARERRDLEISAATAVGRLAKYLVAITMLCLGALVPLVALVSASDPSPLLIPLSFVVLIAVVYAWLQYGICLSQTVTETTAEQRQRLENAADRAGLTATIGGVIPAREAEIARPFLDGPFWNRRVYATDYALDALDDEALIALCARADASDELWLLERRSLVLAFLFGLVVTLTVWTSLLIMVGSVAITAPLLLRYYRRFEFAADRRAARSAGAAPFASAIEIGSDLSDDRGRLSELLASQPSRSRRLERLRDS
ncbi:peptidase [Natrinema sp. H-ect4]|uniref:peptidase n=1 Tax=Natrinema sp. H-ect4 TaxID=3242699 RepID=UPI0035A84AE5